MGIKLIKKESMERCDSCGAVMTEYEYDRYGGLCKYCRSKESKQSEAARGLFDISNAKEILTGGDRYNPVKSVEDEIAWNAYCNGGNRKVLRDCLNDYYGSALCMDSQMIHRLLETYPDELQKLYNACISELTIRDSEWVSFDKLTDSNNSWQADIFFEWVVQNVARRLLRYADESKKSETAPDEYARNNFLEGALDYAEIEDDMGNVVLLKITKRYANEIGGDFCLRSYDGESDKGLAMGGIRYVVDRYGELLDMDPEEAIIEIAKE